MTRTAILTGLLVALSACAASPTSGIRPGPAPEAGVEVGPANGPTGLAAYLPAGALDSLKVLPAPPAPDSAQGLADRAFFDASRAMAGTPRWALAIQDNDLWNGGAMKRYACAMGADLDFKTTPVTWRLLHRLELDVRVVSTPVKKFYDRRRPMVGNDKPICINRAAWMDTNASYPSGHSTTGWAWGLVLTELAPAHADALLNVGREVGESRAICGVHFESDVEAGRTLAAAMVARLHADPGFRRDMARAKHEIAATRTAPKNCPAA